MFTLTVLFLPSLLPEGQTALVWRPWSCQCDTGGWGVGESWRCEVTSHIDSCSPGTASSPQPPRAGWVTRTPGHREEWVFKPRSSPNQTCCLIVCVVPLPQDTIQPLLQVANTCCPFAFGILLCLLTFFDAFVVFHGIFCIATYISYVCVVIWCFSCIEFIFHFSYANDNSYFHDIWLYIAYQ